MGLACSPLLRDPNVGLPELVFVVPDLWSPQYFAVRSRGFRHVVAEQDLADWLPPALARLVAITRARRLLFVACEEHASSPEPFPPVRLNRPATLHAAETNFRTSFMRALLSEHGSRRRAARPRGCPTDRSAKCCAS